jgi:hypothetical protein
VWGIDRVGYTIPLGRLHSLGHILRLQCHVHTLRDTAIFFPPPLSRPLTPLTPLTLHCPRHISPFLFHFRLQIDPVRSVMFLEAMLHHAVLYHAVPCHLTPSHTISCHLTLRYATLCYAVLYSALLCRTVSRHTMQWHIPSVCRTTSPPPVHASEAFRVSSFDSPCVPRTSRSRTSCLPGASPQRSAAHCTASLVARQHLPNRALHCVKVLRSCSNHAVVALALDESPLRKIDIPAVKVADHAAGLAEH